ncbi:MAG: hydantoinase B/oxoprolinase family protein, partial [Streptosporangiales bacterium]
GDGSWQLSQFGGVDQYGSPFAAMYMDSMCWGGPAFSFRDGVDSGGAMVILGGGAPDVEQQEMRQPLLYLWRREVPDAGGAGTYRGGNGIEFALTPIDTAEVTGVLGTHGVTLPNRTGIFGGLPGSCARFERVSGSDTLGWLGAGRELSTLDQLDGRHEVLPGVTPAARIAYGEVFGCTVQNGGGYGDPLLREPGRVARDVRDRAVSVDAAQRLYGVVVVDGSVDDADTERRRAAIRERRRAAMLPPRAPQSADADVADGDGATGSWGASLRTTRAADGTVIASCRHCGGPLGDLADGWEAIAGRVRLGPEDLGALVHVHESLAVTQYVCPHCVTALWVDTEPDGGKTWRDFALHP